MQVSGRSPSNNLQKASPAPWKPAVSLANVLNQYLPLLVCKVGQSDLHRGNTHRGHLPIRSTKHLSFNEMKWSRSVVSNSLRPHGCSLQGSSGRGISQARVLEWVAISFSRVSSRPRDQTRVSHIAGRGFSVWATREACWLIRTTSIQSNLEKSNSLDYFSTIF